MALEEEVAVVSERLRPGQGYPPSPCPQTSLLCSREKAPEAWTLLPQALRQLAGGAAVCRGCSRVPGRGCIPGSCPLPRVLPRSYGDLRCTPYCFIDSTPCRYFT